MAVGTSLAYDKMEELRWTTSLADGTDQVTLDDTYLRTWHIGTSQPRSITVTVSALSDPLTQRQTELIEVTTLMSPAF